jgi:hypothetical protein
LPSGSQTEQPLARENTMHNECDVLMDTGFNVRTNWKRMVVVRCVLSLYCDSLFRRCSMVFGGIWGASRVERAGCRLQTRAIAYSGSVVVLNCAGSHD